MRQPIVLAFLTLALLSATAPVKLHAADLPLIEEILVTAQRIEENARKVPISVSAFTGAMIEDRQIIGISDLQLNVPNFSYAPENFGGARVSIRGIGDRFDLPAFVTSVPVHVNGAMNLVTRRPSFDGLGGYVDFEYGDYDHVRDKGALNLALSDDALVYGFYTQGYRPGGINFVSQSVGADAIYYDSELVQAYEIGAKTLWADHSLMLEAVRGSLLYITDQGRSVLPGIFTESPREWMLTWCCSVFCLGAPSFSLFVLPEAAKSISSVSQIVA